MTPTADYGTRCSARVLARDDRYGGFIDQCESTAGHDGPHQVAYTACEPVAWLSWTGSYEDASPNDGSRP